MKWMCYFKGGEVIKAEQKDNVNMYTNTVGYASGVPGMPDGFLVKVEADNRKSAITKAENIFRISANAFQMDVTKFSLAFSMNDLAITIGAEITHFGMRRGNKEFHIKGNDRVVYYCKETQRYQTEHGWTEDVTESEFESIPIESEQQLRTFVFDGLKH